MAKRKRVGRLRFAFPFSADLNWPNPQPGDGQLSSDRASATTAQSRMGLVMSRYGRDG